MNLSLALILGSASYARAFENIIEKLKSPRPQPTSVFVSMFYQDYMPKFPRMRVNLALTYASGWATRDSIIFDAFGKPTF